jgi:hypothetical protein
VAASFPKAGKYTLFSDYKPAQSPEQISVLKTQIGGESPLLHRLTSIAPRHLEQRKST